MTSLPVLILTVLVVASALVSAALPRHTMADTDAAASEYADLQAAASGHHHGRVQIKVYRGPDEHHGHHHEHFAPHGYWIKQPADDGHH